MLKSVKTQVVWDALKPGKRVLYILPPYYTFTENNSLQTYYSQTLQAILQQRPTYLLFHIENFDFTEETLRAYEAFFQIEIQLLLQLEDLTSPEFMEHHTPQKAYLYNQPHPLPYPAHLFDITINDNLNLQPEGAISGKLILEEFVNHGFYMTKVIARLEQSLGMHQNYDDNYDIAFVLGEEIPHPDQLQELITELIKRNQCSAIYSINTDLHNHLCTFKRTRFPLVLAKQVKEPQLTNTLKKVSLRYSTVLFLGKLILTPSKEWPAYFEKLQQHSLYDPLAYTTFLTPAQQSLYRLTTQPLQLLKRFLEN